MVTDTLCIEEAVDTYLPRLTQTIEELDRNILREYIALLDDARRRSANIWFCGNGGSAATASHAICDLNKGASGPEAPRFRAHSLSDNVATMLAHANDGSYGDIFVEQLRNFLEPGDIVVAISGSGKSSNVLRAVEFAKEQEAITVGFTGFEGGQLRSMVDLSVHVPVDDLQIAEDVHMMIQHLSMQALRALAR